ncbi:MAG: lamin tail domain-containing protein, partial [Planctomycetota bacterium]
MISLRGSVIILLAAYMLLSCTAMAQPPQMSLVGDLYEDNIINYKDLEVFVGYWLDVNCTSPNCPADLDGLAGVNMSDFSFFALNWGKSRVVINEFIADNEWAYADPNGEYDDWIELYNPGPNSVDLGGMYLTDNFDNLTKWQIPEGTIIDPCGFACFWADEQEEQGANHTNFKLDKDGEEIALVDTNGISVIDSIVFGSQSSDHSYVRYPDGTSNWYPTNFTTYNASNMIGRSAPPKFSRVGSVFASQFWLELTSDAPGTEIYYRLDKAPSYTLYTGPILINSTRWVRAYALEPDLLQSHPVSETYFYIPGAGSSFRSVLPIILIDSFGADVESETEFQTVVGSFIDTKKDGFAEITGHPDYSGKMAMHRRGYSSTIYDKKQFRLEIRDINDNDDLSVSLLGMPSESDWILFGPYSDKTLMRNTIMYTWNRDMGRYGVRCRFVEVFLDQDGNGAIDFGDGTESSGTDYWGIYVLMENIKQGKNRIDIDKLRPWHDTEPEISGGYVLKKDWNNDNDPSFHTSVYDDELIYVDPRDDLILTQKNWLDNWFTEFETTLSGPDFNDPNIGYRQYADVLSFIDHHMLVEMAKNYDGYVRSTYLYKERDGKLFMGPVWDFNISLGNSSFDETYLTYNWRYEDPAFPWINPNAYEWYWRIFEDSEFLLEYADRWYELRRESFKTSKMMLDIDQNVVNLLREDGISIKNAVERNFRRWPVLGKYVWPNYTIWSTFQEEIDYLKSWLTDRLNWMDGAIASQYCNGYPPVFNYQGGQVADGFNLIMASPSGTIYYTLDGSDPRLHGGAISPSAFAYSAPVPLTKSVTVKARSLSGGSWTAINSARFSVGPVKDSLRITEIMYHPQDSNDPNDPNSEFIELKNIGVDPINLNMVHFSDGVDFTFGDYVLSPGAYTVVVPSISTFEDKYGTGVSIAGEYVGRLRNGSEEVVIRDAIGTAILEFDYEDDWYPITDGHGFSLTVLNELDPDPNSWDSKTNWRPSVDVNGSPGVDDGSPLHDPDAIIINEVLAHSDGGDPDWIELYNTTGSPINISGWFLSDDKDDLKKFEIQTMPSIPAGAYVVFDQDSHFGDEGNPGCSTAFALSENGESIYFTSGASGELTGYSEVERFGASETGISFGRHVTSTAKIEFPSMDSSTFNYANSDPNVGPIIITEVMYNPEDDKNAEYVELYNDTASTVQLYDYINENSWIFTDGDAIRYYFLPDANIPAYSYALMVKSKADFDFEGYPAVPGSVQIFEWG